MQQFVFKRNLRRQRRASKNYTFLSSFFLLPFPFKPGAINIHASIRVTAFSPPIFFWSILSGFKKLPHRPQSDQQNRQSLKCYFYKIKPARENTLTLVLIWEFLTLCDMGFCSARPTIRTRVLTIYMKTPEIPAGKSHSPRHSVWEAFEIWAAIWVKSGSFSIDDGNCSENISFKMNSLLSNTVAFIPICWKWQM